PEHGPGACPPGPACGPPSRVCYDVNGSNTHSYIHLRGLTMTSNPVSPGRVALAVLLGLQTQAWSQPSQGNTGAAGAHQLPAVSVEASADASAEGLAPAYPGGQVATGARLGILGQQSALETPFGTTSYTQQFIQDQQAASV